MTKNEYIEFGDESLKSFVLISNIKSVTFFDWNKIDPELGLRSYQLDVTYSDETITTWKNYDKEGLLSIYEKIKKALGIRDPEGLATVITDMDGTRKLQIAGIDIEQDLVNDLQMYVVFDTDKTLYNGTSTES